MEYNYIKQGDCLELMRRMEDRCVDVCFTSPPYNDTGNENIHVSSNKYGGGNHKKYLHVETRKDWFEWQCEVIDEMLRVSKRLVVYNVQGLKNNRCDVYKIIGKYADKIHDIVIWHKTNGMPCGTPHKMSNRYEFVILFKPKGVKGVDVNTLHGYTNVIYKDGNRNNPYASIHRAVMSKSFCDEIIKEFTKPNDIVLDPFFGMGTTGVSCIEQNRKYIGFELCQEYVNKSRERIANVKSQVKLDLSCLD